MANPRVLLVDDDRHALAALVRLLSAHCALRVLCATSPQQALTYLDAAPFDCLVTDYALPGISGIHLLALCMERWPDMRRVIYTGRKEASVDFADAILLKGADAKLVADRICELARTPRG